MIPTPRFRVALEDFEVEEIPLEAPAGEGRETWLCVEKRDRNTADVARDLARALGVAEEAVGWAGRKDKRAVARQWLSVPGAEPARALAVEIPGVRVLEAARHPSRLRRGELAGNRFRIAVRDVDAATAEVAATRLAEVERRGMPNRFGAQRFGVHGDNAARGAELLRAPRLTLPRRDAELLVSALQAAVFNAVLDARPVAVDGILAGDLAIDHRTGLLVSGDPAALGAWAERFEVSATGPIFGTKMRGPTGPAGAVEAAVFRDFGIDPRRVDPPRGLRVYGDRRPVRTRVAEVGSVLADGVLRLAFTLPPGAYATVLLGELFPGGLVEENGATGGGPA